jgi:2'-5' RNA ligase
MFADLNFHYEKLFNETKQKVLQNNFEVDNLIDYKNDNRYGITLVIVPSESIKENIQVFLKELKLIEPDQYYYRNSDIHITVMSIISCYEDFTLNKIKVEDYLEVIKKSVENIKSFSIEFTGVTASPSAVMIQGFPSNNNLNIIRDNLRNYFNSINLEKSLDKRYAIQTAHSTVVRFRKEVSKKDSFLEILEKYRNFKFGQFEVNEMNFVANDWYQKNEKVKLIEKLKLLK